MYIPGDILRLYIPCLRFFRPWMDDGTSVFCFFPLLHRCLPLGFLWSSLHHAIYFWLLQLFWHGCSYFGFGMAIFPFWNSLLYYHNVMCNVKYINHYHICTFIQYFWNEKNHSFTYMFTLTWILPYHITLMLSITFKPMTTAAAAASESCCCFNRWPI